MVCAVLGVHSNVAGKEEEFGAGHSWLTISHEGKTDYYGLWSDAHPAATDNGRGHDIRSGLERYKTAVASRFYTLSDAQYEHLISLVESNVVWRYTNNCASWASETVYKVMRENVDANDYAGIETPRELGRSILRLEARHSTSNLNPRKRKKLKVDHSS